jgi:hypothetical protein
MGVASRNNRTLAFMKPRPSIHGGDPDKRRRRLNERLRAEYIAGAEAE